MNFNWNVSTSLFIFCESIFVVLALLFKRYCDKLISLFLHFKNFQFHLINFYIKIFVQSCLAGSSKIFKPKTKPESAPIFLSMKFQNYNLKKRWMEWQPGFKRWSTAFLFHFFLYSFSNKLFWQYLNIYIYIYV